mgnify:FL=1
MSREGKRSREEKEKKDTPAFDRRKTVIRGLKYLAADCPAILPVVVLDAIFEAVYPYIGILLSAAILTGLADPERDMGHLVFLALLLVGANFLGRRILDFCGQLQDVLQYVVMKHVDRSVAEKAWKMEYGMSGDPKINERKWAITYYHYGRGVVALAWQLRNFLQAIATIGISVALTMQLFVARAVGEGPVVGFLNHWMAPVLFWSLAALNICYTIWTSAQVEKCYYRQGEDSRRPGNQMMSLLERCCAEYRKGKELRLFGAGEVIGSRLEALSREVVGIAESAFRYERRATCLPTLFSWLFHMLVYLFVGMKAFFGAFGAGSILQYTGAVTQFGNGITQFSDTVRAFLQNLRYIQDYFDFLDLPGRMDTGTLPVTKQIREDYTFTFRDVTFTYPGGTEPVLHHVNCEFRKGEKLAVVGRNGSGKTTFIKLLCRLYDPEEGEILLNGVDIRRYQYDQYMELFSTVFQDYRIFAFELGENVAAASDYEEDRVIRSLQDAGFGERLKSLEKGLHTPVFKFFGEDGVELSGGESQKVAIARSLYRDAPYLVMDEPTAALDPVAEAEVYQQMNHFARGKGAIYISHRLSSCHFCDRILVFQEGRVVENGTHRELLEAGGLYRKMWDAQAQYYA